MNILREHSELFVTSSAFLGSKIEIKISETLSQTYAKELLILSILSTNSMCSLVFYSALLFLKCRFRERKAFLGMTDQFSN